MDLKLTYLPLLIILGGVVEVFSQIPKPTVDDSAQRAESERRIAAERALRMRNMREFDTTMKPLTQPRTSVPAPPTIDKETAERIQAARRLSAADVTRYGDFLKSDKAGIFKLLPDHDCVAKNVIRTDGSCKDFIMASSSFSFRTRGYIHTYYHDLGLNNGEIFSNAFFSQGIFVSLGDVPVEDVTKSHDALKFIVDLQPASDTQSARTMASNLKSGVDSGGFTYSAALTPVENTTYALRSIAYGLANSLSPVTETTPSSELRFHTLSLDKRADVIVVFRIIRKGGDGSLTIVWKELDRKEAPKIKFGKGEAFADFKAGIEQ